MKEEKRKKLPFGIRKFLREEKARIRQTVAGQADQEKLIKDLLEKYLH